MGNIKIFTDSTCDLGKEYLEKFDISVVPLYVNFDDKSYRDGVDITPGELYGLVGATNKLPLTSAPSPADFYKAFKPFIDEGMNIVYIGLSSELSSTIQNAVIASQEFPEGRIEVIDSLNLSQGIGLLVLKAVDYAKEGLSAKEISERIKNLLPKLRTAFVIDTLDYLHKGGRCSAVQSFIGGILKIRPIVKVEAGKLILSEKLRGKREKSLMTLVNNTLLDKDNINLERVSVISSMSPEDVTAIMKELGSKMTVKEFVTGEAGCVISSHCGPKTVGIIYMVK